jgi:hypothetical protein
MRDEAWTEVAAKKAPAATRAIRRMRIYLLLSERLNRHPIRIMIA